MTRMSDNQVARAWKEHVVLSQMGCCTFHYVLSDTANNSLLVAVGTTQTKLFILFQRITCVTLDAQKRSVLKLGGNQDGIFLSFSIH